MAAGEPFPRLCLFLTLFWTVVLAIAAFVFDVRPLPDQPVLSLGYQTMNLIFIYLVPVYAWRHWREECRAMSRCARDL